MQKSPLPSTIGQQVLNLSGSFKAGETIRLDGSRIADADNFEGWTPTYEYSWEISSDNGNTWSALTNSDATDGDDSYTITAAEAVQLRGLVSYLDGYEPMKLSLHINQLTFF